MRWRWAAVAVLLVGGTVAAAMLYASRSSRRPLIERDATRLIVLIEGMGEPEEPTAPVAVTEPWSDEMVRALLGCEPNSELRALDGSAWSASVASSADVSARIVGSETQIGGGTPPLYALHARGNGPDGLVRRARDVIADVAGAIREMESREPDGKRIAIVLVGHSFGGLVARAVLAAPDDAVGGDSLTPEEQAQAREIGDRTICLITLASPHEGAALADLSADTGNVIGKAFTVLCALMGESLRDEIEEARKAVVERTFRTPAIRDLTKPVWQTLNTGAIAPGTARRLDGSLVPVYALAGHTPTGPFCSREDQGPFGGLEVAVTDPALSERAMSAIEYLLLDCAYRLYTLNLTTAWGTAQGPPLDRADRNLSILNLTKLPVCSLGPDEPGDGEIDTDGLVPVDAALGRYLGTTTEWHFDHSRDDWQANGRRVRGSWYRVDDATVPWLRHNHSEIVRDPAVGSWLNRNIIRAAGPTPGPGSVSGW